MYLLGIIGYIVLVFLAVTWAFGVRVKHDVMIGTILVALTFLVFSIIIVFFDLPYVYSWLFIIIGFLSNFVFLAILMNRVPLITQLLVFVGSLYASLLRIGIPSDVIRENKMRENKARVDEFMSNLKQEGGDVETQKSGDSKGFDWNELWTKDESDDIDDLFDLDENDSSELDSQSLQEKNLLKKYNTISFREYDSGYTARIQEVARRGTTLIFEGSVEDVFSVKDKKYIKIYSFSYNNELCGNLEINDEQADLFLEDADEMDSFYFFITLTKAEPVLNSEKDGDRSDSDKKLFIKGTLIAAEKVVEDIEE